MGMNKYSDQSFEEMAVEQERKAEEAEETVPETTTSDGDETVVDNVKTSKTE